MTVPGYPDVVLVVDSDSMFSSRSHRVGSGNAFHPAVPGRRTTPGLYDVALGIEFDDRWRHRLAGVDLGRGHHAGTMEDPHVVARVDGNGRNHAENPIVWQGFRPVVVNGERRAVRRRCPRQRNLDVFRWRVCRAERDANNHE